jgi:hypothetical protein
VAAIEVISFGPYRLIPAERLLLKEGGVVNVGNQALTISLEDEDRTAIAALPKDQRFVRPPFAPEWDAVV